MVFAHLSREQSIQNCPGSWYNLKGNVHNVQSSWCPTDEVGGCPQIPSSRNPLRWHQPWLPNGTVHLLKEKAWCLHSRSEGGLGEASADGLCHCYHLKTDWSVSFPSGTRAGGLCWNLPLPLQPLLLLPASLPEPSLIRPRQPSGARSSGGHWSQSWQPASRGGVVH